MKRFLLVLAVLCSTLAAFNTRARSGEGVPVFKEEVVSITQFRGAILAGTASQKLILLGTDGKIKKTVALKTVPRWIGSNASTVLVWDFDYLWVFDQNLQALGKNPFFPTPVLVKKASLLGVSDAWEEGLSYVCEADFKGKVIWQWDDGTGGESTYALYRTSPKGNRIAVYNGKDVFVLGTDGQSGASYSVGYEVCSIGLSSEGETAAICDLDNVGLFDTASQKQIVELEMGAFEVQGSVRKNLFYFWNAESLKALSSSGKIEWFLRERAQYITESLSGELLAIAREEPSKGFVVIIIDSMNGRIVSRMIVNISNEDFHEMQWTSDGKKLVLATKRGIFILRAPDSRP